MFYDFQIFALPPLGSSCSFVRAQSPEEARQIVESSGRSVESIGDGVPLPPPEEKRWLDKEEAAWYVGAKRSYSERPSLIDKWMAQGILRRPQQGRPYWTRNELDQVRSRCMGDAWSQPKAA